MLNTLFFPWPNIFKFHTPFPIREQKCLPWYKMASDRYASPFFQILRWLGSQIVVQKFYSAPQGRNKPGKHRHKLFPSFEFQNDKCKIELNILSPSPIPIPFLARGAASIHPARSRLLPGGRGGVLFGLHKITWWGWREWGLKSSPSPLSWDLQGWVHLLPPPSFLNYFWWEFSSAYPLRGVLHLPTEGSLSPVPTKVWSRLGGNPELSVIEEKHHPP